MSDKDKAVEILRELIIPTTGGRGVIRTLRLHREAQEVLARIDAKKAAKTLVSKGGLG